MAFPSVISSFTNPAASNKLNSPSHSAIETAQNNELVQIETVIGTDSSILGTIIGDLRNTTSSGGGHVQSANKGGTGQTAYTKGDLLVATSTSVLAKLAVGTDGQVIAADSTTQAGMKWATNSAPTNVATVFPTPVMYGTAFSGASAYTSSIVGLVGLVNIPVGISVNKITVDVQTGGAITTGTKFGIYSEDGQTLLTSVAAVVAVASVTTLITMPVSSVQLSAGNYYVMGVPSIGTVIYNSYLLSSASDFNKMGKQTYIGTLPVSGGLLPTTFNPSVLAVGSYFPVIRLDT